MDPAKKEAWCQALESDQFKQGQNRLRTERKTIVDYEMTIVEEFCCLGVYCEINGFPRTADGYLSPSGKDLKLHFENDPVLLKEFDSLSYNGEQHPHTKVQRMNDHGANFKKIVAYIRKTL